MRSSMAVMVAAVVGLVPASATAGRVYYGWLYGTEVMPERGAELQTWILEENNKGTGKVKETLLWWSPLVGVTDRLELAFPIELTWERSAAREPEFTFSRWGVEARYRLVSQDLEEAPPFAPLIRVAIKRDVGTRDLIRPEADLVMSYETGRLHALVDLGVVAEITPDEAHFELRPGAGVSIRTVGDLRFGAEVYAEIDLADSGETWVAVGPNLAWTHGRFWLSASFGIGVFQIDSAPRVMWGIAF